MFSQLRSSFLLLTCLALVGVHFGVSTSAAQDLFSDLKKYDKVETPPGLSIEDCEKFPEACDYLKWKLSIVYNLMYQSGSTRPEFFESYEAPPDSCMQMKASLSYDKSAHWSCVFFGIREAIKYELLNLATAKCTDGVDIDTIAIHWKKAQDQCQSQNRDKKLDDFFQCLSQNTNFEQNTKVQDSFANLARLSTEFSLLRRACQNYQQTKGARPLKNDPCRISEYLKFEEIVTNFDWLRANADRISTWQPGFEPHRVPYYFYLRNSCDRKIKAQKKYIKPEVATKECVAKAENNCSEQAKSTATNVFNIVSKLDSGETLDQEQAPKPKKTPEAEKKQNPNKKKPTRSSEIELSKLKDTEFTLDKDIQIQNISKTNSNATTPIANKLKQQALEREKKRLLENSKKEFKPKKESPKSPQEPPSKGADKSLRSKSDLINEAQTALKDFKAGKESTLSFSNFFLETEVHEKKESKPDSNIEAQFKTLFNEWLKSKQKYESLAKQEKGSATDRLMTVMKEINNDFTFQYSRDRAHMVDFLSNEGGNCLAATKLISSVVKDLGLKPDANQVFAVQIFDDHVQPVIYDKTKDEVTILTNGTKQRGLTAPLYRPEVLIHSYLTSDQKDSPAVTTDFLIKDVSDEIKAQAKLRSPKKDPDSNTNSKFNFSLSPSGLRFSEDETPEHANLPWGNGYVQDAKDFYKRPEASKEKAPTDKIKRAIVKTQEALEDMKKALSTYHFKMLLRIKKDPTLLETEHFTPEHIKRIQNAQDQIYKILEAKDYVSDEHELGSIIDLRHLLVRKNPELKQLYEALESERKPFLKTDDATDGDKTKYFNLLKALGPQQWALYKELQTPRKDEHYLSQSLQMPDLPDASLEDLDHYFMLEEKVSFLTNYGSYDGQDTKSQKQPLETDQKLQGNENKQAPHPGSKDKVSPPNGIPFKPEKQGVHKLKAIDFAQFIEQANLTGNDAPAIRWTPAFTAAIRTQRVYNSQFVDWFTGSGFRAVSEKREPRTKIISGPDNRPIPKDIAVLLIDFLRNKDQTSADKSQIKTMIQNNYGSVENYIAQVKSDFELKSDKSKDKTNSQEDSLNTLEVFKKIAKAQGVTSSIFDQAEKNSFRFQTRKPETFLMGFSKSQKDGHVASLDQQKVTLSNAYDIQVTPVTQLQWYLVMKSNPSKHIEADSDGDHFEVNETKLNLNHPVENVTWAEIQEFLKKLKKLDGRCSYRLPTEAEWEAAARAKTTTIYHHGDDPKANSEYGWYWENSKDRTHAVAKKRSNPEGFYDMGGNVWETVQDWYDPSNKVSSNPVTDPTGPPTGYNRISKGGGFTLQSQAGKSAYRDPADPATRSPNSGFRLVRVCP